MKKLSKFVLFAVFVLLVGGAVFLATWDIPAPGEDIERVIPDERFPR